MLEISYKNHTYILYPIFFSKTDVGNNMEVKIGNDIIPQVLQLKYLGSIIQNDGETDKHVTHKIQAGWLKRRKAYGVVYVTAKYLSSSNESFIEPLYDLLSSMVANVGI